MVHTSKSLSTLADHFIVLISHEAYLFHFRLFQPPKMCDFTKNYYIYTSCVDPGAHFFGTSVDGNLEDSCPNGPHERYIVLPGHCPLCGG